MKAVVDKELCVGCGLCAEGCPEVFIMEQDKAKVKSNPVPDASLECCKKVQQDCPVEAIKTEE